MKNKKLNLTDFSTLSIDEMQILKNIAQKQLDDYKKMKNKDRQLLKQISNLISIFGVTDDRKICEVLNVSARRLGTLKRAYPEVWFNAKTIVNNKVANAILQNYKNRKK
jgi:hypothetical protein